MKKNNLNLFAVTLVAFGIIGIATGCSTETTDPKVVKVAFAECGFGRQYLVEWEKGYNAMYPNDPIYNRTPSSIFNFIFITSKSLFKFLCY